MLNGNAPFFKPLLTPFPHRKWVDTTIPSGWECSVFATFTDNEIEDYNKLIELVGIEQAEKTIKQLVADFIQKDDD